MLISREAGFSPRGCNQEIAPNESASQSYSLPSRPVNFRRPPRRRARHRPLRRLHQRHRVRHLADQGGGRAIAPAPRRVSPELLSCRGGSRREAERKPCDIARPRRRSQLVCLATQHTRRPVRTAEMNRVKLPPLWGLTVPKAEQQTARRPKRFVGSPHASRSAASTWALDLVAATAASRADGIPAR